MLGVAAFAVKAKRPSGVTAAQQAAAWKFGTAPLITWAPVAGWPVSLYEDSELEAVWSGQKDAKTALDEAVKRGNEQLRKFEAANK